MKTINRLSIEKARKYLEAKFIELALVKELEEYGLQFFSVFLVFFGQIFDGFHSDIEKRH